MKTNGSPAKELSPWMLAKISLTTKVGFLFMAEAKIREKGRYVKYGCQKSHRRFLASIIIR
jgi:hypothetical protein